MWILRGAALSRYTRGIELILVGSVLAISGLQVARAQSFVGKYGPAKSPEFMPYRQSLQRIQFLEREAAFLSQIIRLPQQVVLSTGECGSENAFYHPKHKAIVLCLELFAQIAKGIQRDFAHKASSEEIRSAVAGAYLFILMHEVGHALIHLLNLPVLGREEDAADQIGAFFLLQASKDPYLLTGALWFFRSKTLIYTRRHFSD